MSQMTDLVPWVRNVAPANDGLHTPLSGLFWWAWNSNSGAGMATYFALQQLACSLAGLVGHCSKNTSPCM